MAGSFLWGKFRVFLRIYERDGWRTSVSLITGGTLCAAHGCTKLLAALM